MGSKLIKRLKFVRLLDGKSKIPYTRAHAWTQSKSIFLLSKNSIKRDWHQTSKTASTRIHNDLPFSPSTARWLMIHRSQDICLGLCSRSVGNPAEGKELIWMILDFPRRARATKTNTKWKTGSSDSWHRAKLGSKPAHDKWRQSDYLSDNKALWWCCLFPSSTPFPFSTFCALGQLKLKPRLGSLNFFLTE